MSSCRPSGAAPTGAASSIGSNPSGFWRAANCPCSAQRKLEACRDAWTAGTSTAISVASTKQHRDARDDQPGGHVDREGSITLAAVPTDRGQHQVEGEERRGDSEHRDAEQDDVLQDGSRAAGSAG